MNYKPDDIFETLGAVFCLILAALLIITVLCAWKLGLIVLP